MAKSSSDEIVARRVREARLKRKLSKSELGRRIGISYQAYKKLEDGRTNYTVSRLLKISEATGFSLFFFTQDL